MVASEVPAAQRLLLIAANVEDRETAAQRRASECCGFPQLNKFCDDMGRIGFARKNVVTSQRLCIWTATISKSGRDLLVDAIHVFYVVFDQWQNQSGFGAGLPKRDESVHSSFPYGYLDELRQMLATGLHFRDWQWAHSALG